MKNHEEVQFWSGFGYELYSNNNNQRIDDMRHPIEKYIDTCLISEYADKDLKYGYSLDVAELPNHEKLNFLDFLLKYDPILRDMILDRMHELVAPRLERMEMQHKYDAGLIPHLDQNNGEVNWIARGAV